MRRFSFPPIVTSLAFLIAIVVVLILPGCNALPVTQVVTQPSTQSVTQPVRQSELNRGSQTGETRSQVIISNGVNIYDWHVGGPTTQPASVIATQKIAENPTATQTVSGSTSAPVTASTDGTLSGGATNNGSTATPGSSQGSNPSDSSNKTATANPQLVIPAAPGAAGTVGK